MPVLSPHGIRNGFKRHWSFTRSAGEWDLLPVPPYKSRGKEESSMKTKDLSLITVYAALYAAMVVVFSPISFAALQFRVAGVLRPGIARKRELAIAYAIGTVVANVFSPFSGIYELLFMPVMSLIAGLVGYEAAKRFNGNYYVCGAVVAIIIPLSVSWMLGQLFNLPYAATLPSLIISEQVINALGATVFKQIESRYKWWE
jgi:uncharacterized membrane protein